MQDIPLDLGRQTRSRMFGLGVIWHLSGSQERNQVTRRLSLLPMVFRYPWYFGCRSLTFVLKPIELPTATIRARTFYRNMIGDQN